MEKVSISIYTTNVSRLLRSHDWEGGRGSTGGQSVLLNFSKEIRLVFPFCPKNSRLNYDGTMILFLR